MSHDCVCELEDSWYIHSTIDTLTSDFTAGRFLIAATFLDHGEANPPGALQWVQTPDENEVMR
jgi:hypothetical protein